MNKYCECENNPTRNFTEAHNNLCPQCGKKLIAKINFCENPPKFQSPEKRKTSENIHYQNNNSTALGVDNLSFTENSNACNCPVKPSDSQFCPECGGTTPLYSNLKPENHLPTHTFTHELPHSSLNTPPNYIDPVTQHLYDNPILLRPPVQTLHENNDEDTDTDQTHTSSDSDSEIEEELHGPHNNEPGVEQVAPPDNGNLNDGVPVLNQPLAINANMEHLPHLYGLRPPRFESRKSDIRKFFQRFNNFLVQHDNWNDAQKVGYFSNLIDDEGLDFFESLPEEIRGNYNDTQQAFITHYDSVQPPSTQWSLITKRKQIATESVTDYHDDLLRMAARLEIPAQTLLFVFLDGLPEQTKLHIALSPNPPADMGQALTLAKTHQAITGTHKSPKDLLQKVKDENTALSAAIRNTDTQYQINLQAQIDKLADKLDKITNTLADTPNPHNQKYPTFQERNPMMTAPQQQREPSHFFQKQQRNDRYPRYPFNPQGSDNLNDNNFQRNRNNNQNYNKFNFPPRQNFSNRPSQTPYQPRYPSGPRPLMRQNINPPWNPQQNNQYRSQFPINQQSSWNNNQRNVPFTPRKLYDPQHTHTSNAVQLGELPFKPTNHTHSPVHYDPISMTLSGQINNTPCRTLIDTGSEITLISKKYFDTLSCPSEIRNPRCLNIKAVNGNTVKLLGEVDLPLTVENHTVFLTLQIIPDIDFDIVLGRDQMASTVASIDYQKSIITFVKTPKQTPIKLAECNFVHKEKTPLKGLLKQDTTIPPHEKITTYLRPDNPTAHQSLRMKGLPSLVTDKLIISFDSPKTTRSAEGFPCTLSNISSIPVTLPKDTQVSWLEGIPSIPKKVYATTLQPITHNLPDTPTSPEDLQELKTLLENNREVFAAEDSEIGKIGILQHVINIGDAPPIRSRPYRVNHDTQQKIDTHIQTMLENGIIEYSNSAWSSPVLLVKKKDSTETRFCVDYRRLNKVTVKDSYPIPNIEEILDNLGSAQYFTTLDMKNGFFQVEVEENSRQYTAFVCTNGLYQFKRLPFGLCNNPSTFSRIMTYALTGLTGKICFNYIDDIIVYSRTFNEHLQDLQTIFTRLLQYNLKLNPKKCHFARKSIHFLGHVLSADGISPDPSKILVVQNHPTPQDKKELKSFLGLVNYYRKFLSDVAKISEPLNKLLRKNVPFIWNNDCETSFSTLKEKLTTPPLLAFPNFDHEFHLNVDACNSSLGFILSQKYDNSLKVIAYAGRSLNKHERNYSINELEALSVVTAVRHFDVYLSGRKFKIFSDNTSVTWLYKQTQPKGKYARWIMALQEYDFEIIHKPGRVNSDADCISRIPNLPPHLAPVVATNIAIPLLNSDDKLRFSQDQQTDPDLQKIISDITSDNDTKHIREMREKYILDSDNLLWKKTKSFLPHEHPYRLAVPQSQKPEILRRYHDDLLAGHKGSQITYNKIHSRYYWKNLFSEVENYCKTCNECAKKKVLHEIKAPLYPITAQTPFEKVGLDIIGPLPITDTGNTHILVFIDYLTKWTESIPLSQTDAPEIAKHLYSELICRHGTPEVIITDNASNFASKLMTEVCKILRISLQFAPTYHSMGNGAVERLIQTLTRTIALYVSQNQKDWDCILPGILFGYRTSRHTSTKETPFHLLYGRRARLPNDVTSWQPPNLGPAASKQTQDIIKNIHIGQEMAKKNIEATQISMKSHYDEKTAEPTFQEGDKVLIRDTMKRKGVNPKLQPKYRGPFTLIKRLTPVTFEFDNSHDKRMKNISHVNRMKPYFSIDDRIIRDEIPPPDSPPIRDQPTHTTTPPLVQENSEPIVQWDDDIVILKHRNRNQRVDYLIKKTSDPDHLAHWVTSRDLGDNPLVQTYLNNLPKPSTRQNQPATPTTSQTALVYNTRQAAQKKITFFFLYQLVMIFCFFSPSSSQPQLGPLFDCSIVHKLGIYSTPIEPLCQNFHLNDVKHYKADVRRYRETIHNLNLYHCTTERITLKCKENFLGVISKSINIKMLSTTFPTCISAIKTKKTSHGPLVKIGPSLWQSKQAKAFDCTWMETNSITFVRLKISRYTGHIRDRDPTIHQDLTSTPCTLSNPYCRPREKPLSIITWVFKLPTFQIFQSLGIFNVSQIHQYVLIPKLAVGGSIIKKTLTSFLTDTGYILKWLNPPFSNKPTKTRNITNKNFMDFSTNYVTNTKSSSQRDIAEGYLGKEILLENKLISLLAALNCRTRKQLHRLQRLMLTSFPDVPPDYLFPRSAGVHIQTLGDAFMLHSCQKVESYTIWWNQTINSTCYHQFPLTSKNFTGIRFLELKTRRIFPTSHHIECTQRPRPLFIKDVDEVFWKYTLPHTFQRITPKTMQKHNFVLNLPTLATFNQKLKHYCHPTPHRTTLLSLLSKHQENLEILSQFKEKGNGNIIIGLTRAIASTVSFLVNTGEEVFHTLSNGVIMGIKTITNATEDVIETSTHGIAEIFASIGISNLVLYILNFFIIVYLILMRFQFTSLRFLFPPTHPHTIHEKSVPSSPPRNMDDNITPPVIKPRHNTPLPPPVQV